MSTSPRPPLFHRLITALVIASLTLSCNFISRVATSSSPLAENGERLSFAPGDPAPQIPAPPPLAAVPAGSPDEQAAALSANLVGGSADLPTWLRLYDLFVIPVIDQNGLALGSTGADPIGPRYWFVWYMAAQNRPGRGISLLDVGRLMAFGSPNLDPASLGKYLLADLQTALSSEDPQARLLGQFVRQRSLQTGARLDLADPAASPELISIDPPSAAILYWVMLRQYAFLNMNLATAQAPQPDQPVRVVFPAAPSDAALNQAANSQPPCSEVLGDSDLTYWFNWLIKQGVSGGLHVPGMENPLQSLVGVLQEELKMSASAIKIFGDRLAAAGAATSALSFVMQLMALDVFMTTNEEGGLVRNKRASEGPGKSVTITWKLYSNLDKLPDGNNTALCFLSTLTNMFGVGISMPASGPVADAEIMFVGGKGFDRVMFGDYMQIRSFTDQTGSAFLKVIGRQQKVTYPDDAKPLKMEYTVLVSAQPEGAGMNTILNHFLNGLAFGAGGMNLTSGIIGPIIDMLKVARYDLGEYAFPMVDWAFKGYNASGSSGESVISGVVCSLSEPFELKGTCPGGEITSMFTPDIDLNLSGVTTFSGVCGGVNLSGSGTYTVKGIDTNSPVIIQEIAGCNSTGNFSCGSSEDAITLTPLEGEGCK